jgi:hypothetical protein
MELLDDTFYQECKLPANQRKHAITLCVVATYGTMFLMKLDALTILLSE